MVLPLQIISHDIALTEAIETKIRRHAKKLDRFFSRITSCHVAIKVPNKHHHKGHIYDVRLDIRVPGKEIAVTHAARPDLYGAVREAFEDAARQLEDYARLRRGDVKQRAQLDGR